MERPAVSEVPAPPLGSTPEAALEAERRLIAADLHDSVAQTLTFVKMRLPLLEQSIEAADNPQSLRYLREVSDAISQAHKSLRSILDHYRAPVPPKGLQHALSQAAREFPRSCGVELDYSNRARDVELTREQQAQVVHVVREALANIAQHAHARHAWLRVDAQGDRVEVVVEDDGDGPIGNVEPAHGTEADAVPSGHHGLAIMGERARRLGGQLEVAARAGGGTRVRLAFPIGSGTSVPRPGVAASAGPAQHRT